MKKIFCIFIAIALCMCMCACGGPITHVDNCLFERVASYNDCSIYRNVKTDVLYVNMGSAMSVLLNADGTPMVWSGR